jgi:O-antigen/teichoic acid export membrane protein
MARGHDGPCALIVGATVAIYLVGCVFLIPRWGAAGIAYSFVVCEVASFVMLLAYVVAQDLFPRSGVLKLSLEMLVVILVFGALNRAFDGRGAPLVANLAPIAAYPLVLLACRVVAWSDLVRLQEVLLRSVFQRKPRLPT